MPALPSLAADFSTSHLNVPRTLPNLGPAGNGRRLWVEYNCYLCHGSNGGGQFGPNIQQAESGDVSEAVTQGIPEAGMPSYGKYVTKTDITNLTAYLNSVGTANEPKWWDWWIPHPTE
jgi:mono/diheme cytochrome c family protein